MNLNENRKSTVELLATHTNEPYDNTSNTWVKLSECDEFIGPK